MLRLRYAVPASLIFFHHCILQMFHLRALNEVERQRWVTALELAKTQAIKKLEGKIILY